jgi:hypothetical protein
MAKQDNPYSPPASKLASPSGVRSSPAGRLRSVLGTIPILAGLYAILFWYGYSTMIDPSLPDSV